MRLGAMTSEDLMRWSSSVSGRLGGTLGKNQAHREAWTKLMSMERPPDAEVLDALEHDAAVAVAFVRAYQDARRIEWEELEEGDAGSES